MWCDKPSIFRLFSFHHSLTPLWIYVSRLLPWKGRKTGSQMVQTLFFSQLKIAIQAKTIMIKELSSIQGTMVHSQSERRIIYNLIQMNQRDRVTSNRHLVSISGYMICSLVPLGTKLSTLIGCVQKCPRILLSSRRIWIEENNEISLFSVCILVSIHSHPFSVWGVENSRRSSSADRCKRSTWPTSATRSATYGARGDRTEAPWLGRQENGGISRLPRARMWSSSRTS